jgi:hypothetical protein
MVESMGLSVTLPMVAIMDNMGARNLIHDNNIVRRAAEESARTDRLTDPSAQHDERRSETEKGNNPLQPWTS